MMYAGYSMFVQVLQEEAILQNVCIGNYYKERKIDLLEHARRLV